MLNLLGEYNCKVDTKGRFMLPAPLKKDLVEILPKGFVMNRNIHQKSLQLYPIQEWEKISKKLNSLNRFIKKNDVFVRRVLGGATKIEVDKSGRVLLPKSLFDYAGLGSEIKVVGNGMNIEVWNKANYEKVMDEEVDFEELADDVMGDISFEDE